MAEPNGRPDPQTELFANYIRDRTVLIADTSAVSRASLASMLSSLGAKTANLLLTSSYQDAETTVGKVKPDVMICDYDLGRRCGLDLLQQQRVSRPDATDSIFILVTANTSQTAVARAAEEDVDTYILKPFTPNTLRNSLVRAILAKIHPDEYARTIQQGKDELSMGNIPQAIALFEKAKTMDTTPSLACFYLGQANLLKEALELAESSYNTGLGYNKIHYKCLVGLYEIHMSRERFNDAYEVVKKISHYFPANPQRLSAVLKLAIQTRSYDDVERYYQIFTKIDDRNEMIIRHICAALVVCGKYYLQNKLASRALELFRKAGVTASGRVNILQEIILALVDAALPKEAAEYLKRFPPDSQSTPTYLALEYLVLDRSGTPAALVIDQGRRLLSSGTRDPLIYLVLIRRSMENNLRAAAESLFDEAVAAWPDRRKQFDDALRKRWRPESDEAKPKRAAGRSRRAA